MSRRLDSVIYQEKENGKWKSGLIVNWDKIYDVKGNEVENVYNKADIPFLNINLDRLLENYDLEVIKKLFNELLESKVK